MISNSFAENELMTLPEFVFLAGKIVPGSELILSTVKPYSIFRIYQFYGEKEIENFIIKYNLLNECAVVPGYNIAICYVGNIEKIQDVPVLGHSIPGTVKSLYQPLLEFYERERITGNESRQKKYRKQ